MANVLVEENSLTAIANAIRNKNDSNTTYKPSEMDEAINDLVVVNNDRWVRPAAWPDYSQVDISEDEVIYLTYETSMEDGWISIRVFGDYKVERGSLTNGIFTAVDSTNCDSGTSFQEPLPTNEGTYVVYKITPQFGAHLERFAFARRDDLNSSLFHYAQQQPCIERYARLPYWVGTKNRTADQYVWTTVFLIADTIMNATPNGSMANGYNDGNIILEKIDLSTCNFSQITNLSSTFTGKNKLHELLLPHNVSSSCTTFASCFINCIRLKYLDLTGWNTSGATTMSSMFEGCRHLIQIKGIENFNVASCTTLSKMFYACFDLQKLNLSNWETSNSLTSIADMFNQCRSLIQLDVSKFNVSNVTALNYVFSTCVMLENLDLRNWVVSSKCTTLAGMFAYNPSLKEIKRTLNWDTSNVTSFDSMFRECRLLKSIDISDFDFSKATTVRYMFLHCNNLENITATVNLPKVTSRANVGDFLGQCWKLKNLSNITFTNCSFVPGFSYDYSLENIAILSTITGLGESCLRDLRHCKYIDFSNVSVVPALSSANDIISGYNTQLKIFVPTNLFESWVTTTNWNNAAIVARTFPASDFDLYNNTAQNTATIDLSGVTWRKNSGYSTTAAVGAAYTTVVPTNSAGKRIASDLIEIPNNTESICITVNPGYSFSVIFFNSNDGYLKNQLEWYTSPLLIHPSTALATAKFVVVVRIGNGDIALAPDDWENSGLTIKYVPVS